MGRNDHKHIEAFCLMKYRSDDGTEEEIIWNSRDGVTPFVITLRSGKSATHVDWQSDVYAPDYVPKSGDRIFIDLTMEKALEYAERNLKAWKLDEGEWAPTVEELARSYMRDGEAPDIKEIE
jgi:hypothetical protein